MSRAARRQFVFAVVNSGPQFTVAPVVGTVSALVAIANGDPTISALVPTSLTLVPYK